MSADIQFPGHRQRVMDSGEYLCECGWSPSWNSSLSLNEQIAAHKQIAAHFPTEPLDLAQLRPIMESAQAWEGVRVNVALELLDRLEAAEAKVARLTTAMADTMMELRRSGRAMEVNRGPVATGHHGVVIHHPNGGTETVVAYDPARDERSPK